MPNDTYRRIWHTILWGNCNNDPGYEIIEALIRYLKKHGEYKHGN